MNITKRNNVNVIGNGSKTMVLAHGFGCDQNMWRFLTPYFMNDYRIVMFDLVGSGCSDIYAYDSIKYDSLHGYADDLIEIIDEFSDIPVILVGHSVSAIIGLLATIKAPQLFHSQIMVAPSPSYINDGHYVGGFDRENIDELISALENNYLGWSSSTAPAIMGTSNKPELGEELTNSFCNTNPDIAKQFAKVTFLSDHRSDLPKSTIPALIIQCDDDFIAPVCVGEYMKTTMQQAHIYHLKNVGHCPHMSSPEETTKAIREFLPLLN